MKFFRYRRPSLKTLLGVTKAKKRVKKELGITEAMKPFRWWTNTKRRFKRKVGYESEAGRLIRNGLPRPGGCLVVVILLGTAVTVAAVKTEFGKYGDVLTKVQKKLQEATNTIDTAAVRTRAIERKLRDVQELPIERAQTVLMLENSEEDGEVEESPEAQSRSNGIQLL